jgi:hypothetical protein
MYFNSFVKLQEMPNLLEPTCVKLGYVRSALSSSSNSSSSSAVSNSKSGNSRLVCSHFPSHYRHVNFSKMRMIYNIISEMMKGKEVPYKFVMIPQIFIPFLNLNLEFLDKDTLENLSRNVEPPSGRS